MSDRGFNESKNWAKIAICSTGPLYGLAAYMYHMPSSMSSMLFVTAVVTVAATGLSVPLGARDQRPFTLRRAIKALVLGMLAAGLYLKVLGGSSYPPLFLPAGMIIGSVLGYYRLFGPAQQTQALDREPNAPAWHPENE